MGFMYACEKDSPLNGVERAEKRCASMGGGWIYVLTKLAILVCLGLFILCSNMPQLDSRNKAMYGEICLYSGIVGGVCVLVQALDYLLGIANNASEQKLLPKDKRGHGL